jgi:hypothetical protein
VVFTWADVLRNMSIERHIKREAKDLQWVLEKCKMRYFVISNYIFGEHPQLWQLMEKIEKVVAEEGIYNPEDVEEKKLLGQNQSLELGARPKVNSAVGLAKMDMDPPHKKNP